MCEVESIYYFSSIILNVLIISGLIWFVVSLFKVRDYERKITKLHKELELKIMKEKDRRASMEIINLRIKHLKEEYRPNIEKLERGRKFILDKLPFFK